MAVHLVGPELTVATIAEEEGGGDGNVLSAVPETAPIKGPTEALTEVVTEVVTELL